MRDHVNQWPVIVGDKYGAITDHILHWILDRALVFISWRGCHKLTWLLWHFIGLQFKCRGRVHKLFWARRRSHFLLRIHKLDLVDVKLFLLGLSVWRRELLCRLGVAHEDFVHVLTTSHIFDLVTANHFWKVNWLLVVINGTLGVKQVAVRVSVALREHHAVGCAVFNVEILVCEFAGALESRPHAFERWHNFSSRASRPFLNTWLSWHSTKQSAHSPWTSCSGTMTVFLGSWRGEYRCLELVMIGLLLTLWRGGAGSYERVLAHMVAGTWYNFNGAF